MNDDPAHAWISTQFDGQYHLRIWRDDGAEIRFTWSELQAIKNEVVGPDVEMVEVFPREEDVVNEANVRHFWVTTGMQRLRR